eukprot:jgi/Psemu1/304323/fgenesh1_kg.146_\
MAHRSIQSVARRGFGLAAQHFQASASAAATAPSAVAARSFASVASANANPTSEWSLRGRWFFGGNSEHSRQQQQQQHRHCQHNQRSYSSTTVPHKREYNPSPLDAFRDPVDRATRMEQPVGRQWSVKELRRKSYEDLHRLWYVLYKEKNMLLTERQLSRRRQLIFPQPDRFKKVQKSMGAIRQVLGERKRETVAAHLARHEERELAKRMEAESETQDTYEEAMDEAGSETTK